MGTNSDPSLSGGTETVSRKPTCYVIDRWIVSFTKINLSPVCKNEQVEETEEEGERKELHRQRKLKEKSKMSSGTNVETVKSERILKTMADTDSTRLVRNHR